MSFCSYINVKNTRNKIKSISVERAFFAESEETFYNLWVCPGAGWRKALSEKSVGRYRAVKRVRLEHVGDCLLAVERERGTEGRQEGSRRAERAGQREGEPRRRGEGAERGVVIVKHVLAVERRSAEARLYRKSSEKTESRETRENKSESERNPEEGGRRSAGRKLDSRSELELPQFHGEDCCEYISEPHSATKRSSSDYPSKLSFRSSLSFREPHSRLKTKHGRRSSMDLPRVHTSPRKELKAASGRSRSTLSYAADFEIIKNNNQNNIERIESNFRRANIIKPKADFGYNFQRRGPLRPRPNNLRPNNESRRISASPNNSRSTSFINNEANLHLGQRVPSLAKSSIKKLLDHCVILSQIRSANVEKVIDYVITQGLNHSSLWYVLEFTESMSLHNLTRALHRQVLGYDVECASDFVCLLYSSNSLLDRSTETFPDFLNIAVYIAAQILVALFFLHGKEIIVSNLNPSNIRMTSKGVLKITDLGPANKYLYSHFDSRSISENLSFITTPGKKEFQLRNINLFIEPNFRATLSKNKNLEVKTMSSFNGNVFPHLDYFSCSMILFQVLFGFTYGDIKLYKNYTFYEYFNDYELVFFFPDNFIKSCSKNRTLSIIIEEFLKLKVENLKDFLLHHDYGFVDFLMEGLSINVDRWSKYTTEITTKINNKKQFDFGKLKTKVPCFKDYDFNNIRSKMPQVLNNFLRISHLSKMEINKSKTFLNKGDFVDSEPSISEIKSFNIPELLLLNDERMKLNKLRSRTNSEKKSGINFINPKNQKLSDESDNEIMYKGVFVHKFFQKLENKKFKNKTLQRFKVKNRKKDKGFKKNIKIYRNKEKISTNNDFSLFRNRNMDETFQKSDLLSNLQPVLGKGISKTSPFDCPIEGLNKNKGEDNKNSSIYNLSKYIEYSNNYIKMKMGKNKKTEGLLKGNLNVKGTRSITTSFENDKEKVSEKFLIKELEYHNNDKVPLISTKIYKEDKSPFVIYDDFTQNDFKMNVKRCNDSECRSMFPKQRKKSLLDSNVISLLEKSSPESNVKKQIDLCDKESKELESLDKLSFINLFKITKRKAPFSDYCFTSVIPMNSKEIQTEINIIKNCKILEEKEMCLESMDEEIVGLDTFQAKLKVESESCLNYEESIVIFNLYKYCCDKKSFVTTNINDVEESIDDSEGIFERFRGTTKEHSIIIDNPVRKNLLLKKSVTFKFPIINDIFHFDSVRKNENQNSDERILVKSILKENTKRFGTRYFLRSKVSESKLEIIDDWMSLKEIESERTLNIKDTLKNTYKNISVVTSAENIPSDFQDSEMKESS